MFRVIAGEGDDQTSPLDPFLLVSEADHRIANSLALVCGLIRTKASSFKGREAVSSQEVSGTLREIAVQVETVARLSRLLSRRPGDDLVNISEHLRDVCDLLSDTLAKATGMTIASSFEAECLVPQEKVLPISLIVNEAVTNAVKYAHPTGVNGRVEVTFRRRADGVAVLTVADDGVGFPEGFNAEASSGLGFRVIRALSSQLGGAHSFESGALGLTFRLDMPR